MIGAWTAKKTPIKDKVEIAAQLRREWDWPADTDLHNTVCKDCQSHGGGNFRLVWAGDYIGTDWTTQRRISFRCNKCGKIVTFFDRTDSDGRLIGNLERQVITP
jgi:RNase P subunit RPR2